MGTAILKLVCTVTDYLSAVLKNYLSSEQDSCAVAAVVSDDTMLALPKLAMPSLIKGWISHSLGAVPDNFVNLI
jgi:hypothetical protein